MPTTSAEDAATRQGALAQYRRRAAVYDLELAAFEPLRRRAVARLGLAPGDRVLDVGCGTGLSLPLLAKAVGPAGAVVGVEQCDSMLRIARERIARQGWTNARLLHSPVQTADFAGALPGRHADAAIFHFTHDILQSDAALENVAGCLRPGAVVVAVGLQWAPAWCWPVNFFVWPAAVHSVSSLEGLDRPWRKLGPWIDGLEVTPLLGGGAFLARGVRSARRP